MSIRVVIADDQQLVRAGFRMIIDSRDDLTVVGEAANGEEAIVLTAAEQPDVVLMDIRMPVLDGIAATRQIRGSASASHDTRVLVLTTFDLDEFVYAALQAGASGFLLKDTPPGELIEAIRVVARGDALLAPSVTRRLIERFAAQPPSQPDDGEAFGNLTPRETEVLRLVARGLSNAEIAATLFVGETTVKSHVARLLMKLDVHDRVQAVVLAYERGFVRPGSTPRG